MIEQFFLGRDQSSHWYLVPFENRQEWLAWKALDDDDERSWKVPDFAKPIDGPHKLRFENPTEI